MVLVGLTYAKGPSSGYRCGTQTSTGILYVSPAITEGTVPCKHNSSAGLPYSSAELVAC